MASSSIHALSLRSLKVLVFHSIRPAASAQLATRTSKSDQANVKTRRSRERDLCKGPPKGDHPNTPFLARCAQFWKRTGAMKRNVPSTSSEFVPDTPGAEQAPSPVTR